MAENLFPVFETPSTLAEDVIFFKKYRPAPLFDIQEGEFVLDGARVSIWGSGYDAWVLWCTKTILTQRWGYYGYGSNIGIEANEAFMQTDRKAVQSAFERTITEALLADPMGRTRLVRDFKFSWLADSLYITCTVFGDDGNTAAISANLKT